MGSWKRAYQYQILLAYHHPFIFSECHFETTEEIKTDYGSKLCLFQLRVNLVNSVTKLQLRHPGFSSQEHKTFPHCCFFEQPWPPLLLQVSLKHHLIRKPLFNQKKKKSISQRYLSFLALYFPSLHLKSCNHTLIYLSACFTCKLD